MKILETFKFPICREEPNFDRACDSARNYALTFAGIDEDGNSSKIDWCRSTDSILIEFENMAMNGGMCGWEYVYNFNCSIIRN